MSPTLWIVLLLALAALGVFVWLRRTTRAPRPTLPPVTPGDELGSLGLSEVRPATAPRTETVPRPEPSAPSARATASSSPTMPRPSEPPISTVSEVRPKSSTPDDAFVRSDSPLWADGAEAVRHLLRSLAVALGGGVAVLRHEDDAYAIDALIGVPGVRTPRPLRADDHPLHRVPQDTVLTILGPESRRTLRYYAEPEAAVGQAVARALAEPPARRVLLVADVPPEHDELDDDALELIARYGDLLATMTNLEDAIPDASASETSASEDTATEEDAGVELASEPDDAAEPSDAIASSTNNTAAQETDVLPRAVVIQNQMDAAGRDDRPLAFALVTLAAADAVLRGDPERVATAEAKLRERLSGDGVRAVEPFGDLMLGVFLEATPDEALAWTGALADTEPPLLVGLVPTATGDPETIRAAATGALEEAYHQGGGVAVASA